MVPLKLHLANLDKLRISFELLKLIGQQPIPSPFWLTLDGFSYVIGYDESGKVVISHEKPRNFSNPQAVLSSGDFGRAFPFPLLICLDSDRGLCPLICSQVAIHPLEFYFQSTHRPSRLFRLNKRLHLEARPALPVQPKDLLLSSAR